MSYAIIGTTIKVAIISVRMVCHFAISSAITQTIADRIIRVNKSIKN
jgi:hypothetical protein